MELIDEEWDVRPRFGRSISNLAARDWRSVVKSSLGTS